MSQELRTITLNYIPVMTPGPYDTFPGTPDTFPEYIGPFPGLLLMEILIGLGVEYQEGMFGRQN